MERETETLQEVWLTNLRAGALLVCGGALLGGYWITASRPGSYLTAFLIAAPLLALATVAALRLDAPRVGLAARLWLALAALGLTLAVILFPAPGAAYLIALLPLVAAFSGPWLHALAAGLGAMALGIALPLPPVTNFFLTVGGPIVALLAGIAAGTFRAEMKRALVASTEARGQLESFRGQRVELLQTQQDLMLANRELARLSERLKALTQVAEDARRVKEEFVANVSHELRTPLNMIIGFSELIAKAPEVYGGLPPALLADIAAIQRNSQHLSELVNDVLDLSQIEAGRMTLVRDWTTLQELVDAAVSATQVLFEMKGLYLRSELPAEPLALFCDRTRIREVLLNLLSNAGRFTERGGVTVSAEMEGEWLLVRIADTGPGIAPEDQARLFEPFQQLDNSIRREGGSGLGLSISKRFIELHGGSMGLESTPGKGTTFFFRLPCVPEGRSPAVSGAHRWVTPYTQPERVFQRSKAPAPVLSARYVLLDPGGGLERLFRRFDSTLEIVRAVTVEDARAELARSPAQAFVVNGAALDLPCGQLETATMPYVTPVITCWVPSGDDEARRLGAWRYLVKPVSREALLAALDDLRVQTGRAVQTLLLVDDQPELLQLFGRMLASTEPKVTVLRARGGQQALDLLRQRQPDALLLDLVMPGLDGFAVLREKNADPAIQPIPTLLVSSKDPTGQPLVSQRVVVERAGGLSAREVLACVQAVTGALKEGGNDHGIQPGAART